VLLAKGVPFNHSFQNYVKVFEVLGYSHCDNPSLEDGFEKVALFSSNRWFEHVSHQLEDGKWTSKLGPDEDIKHPTVGALESNGTLPAYGMVTRIMKRRRQIWEKPKSKTDIVLAPVGVFKNAVKTILFQQQAAIRRTISRVSSEQQEKARS